MQDDKVDYFMDVEYSCVNDQVNYIENQIIALEKELDILHVPPNTISLFDVGFGALHKKRKKIITTLRELHHELTALLVCSDNMVRSTEIL